MTPALFLALAIDPALRLLPESMRSDNARAMVLACCVQESGLTARRQQPVGPARSFAQFEKIGIAGVLTHPRSRTQAVAICNVLEIEPQVETVYKAIEFCDVLCAAFSRLLLFSAPQHMPGRLEVDVAWHIYESRWRPGKPRPEKWPSSTRR